ncbi:MAG: metal-dependent hydrolase [Kiritimatiellae bacterium]|nr:metal-dependent hydrolase [Kiritimatiellia bacterium]
MGAALWSLWDAHRPASSEPVSRVKRVTGFVGFLGASMLPDLDVVPGVLTGDMHSFHNQEMHSLFAAAGFSLLAGWMAGRLRGVRFSGGVFAITFVSYFLHLLMDLFTYGRGLRLFWPLYSGRIQAPVEVFGGLRWSEGVLYAGHWVTFFEELVFATLLFLLVWGIRKKWFFGLK